MQVQSLGQEVLRRTRRPTLIFLPGKSHGQRNLAGYSPQRYRVGHDSHWARMQDEAKVRNLSPKTQAMDPSESNKRRILSLFKKKFSTEECLHSFSDAMRQEQEKIISSLSTVRVFTLKCHLSINFCCVCVCVCVCREYVLGITNLLNSLGRIWLSCHHCFVASGHVPCFQRIVFVA